MKTKIISVLSGMLIVSLLASSNAMAQQKNPGFGKDSYPAMLNNAAAVYTYRVFEAPNKMFGYDIFKNGRGIFHQPAAMGLSKNATLTAGQVSQNTMVTEMPNQQHVVLSKKEHAENAALLSIEKIEKQMLPELTREEVTKIIASSISTTK